MGSKINQSDDKAVYGADIRRQRGPKPATMAETGSTRAAAASNRNAPGQEMVDANKPEQDTNLAAPGVDLTGDQAARDRHTMRMGWFLSEASRQAANRVRMAKCENYYDSEQWAYDKAQALRDRGQEPITYNEIKPTIDWLIGTERRARVDFQVIADATQSMDTDEADQADEDARNKTKLLKWLNACNRSEFERSWAAEDAFKAGQGWLEVGFSGARGKAPVYTAYVPWRDILPDSKANRRDYGDGRFIFRIKVVDADVAHAIFPNMREAIDRCVQMGDNLSVFSQWFTGASQLINGLDSFSTVGDSLDEMTAKPVDMFNARQRVMLVECWSREPIKRSGDLPGLGDPLEYRIHVAIMTEFDTLLETASPYKHDRFPFVPVWAYRNKRTGLPYSPIWPLIGPQDGLNQRMSKSLFEANANQWEIEKTAVDNLSMGIEDIRDELNDPNGMVVWAAGALSGQRVRKIEHTGKASEQLGLAEADRSTLRSMSGVTGENRGEQTNSVSGKAVIAKQNQGSLLTGELFDNILLAHQLEGEILLSVAEQALAAPRVIPSVGGAPGERVHLNQPQEDGTYLNDITARKARFVTGEQQWRQSYAEAAFSELMEMMTQLAPAAPQAVVNLLDLVFDMHPTLPRKRQIVTRMRQINGQSDPDGKVTPEQQAAMAQQQAIQKAQFEAQMAQLVADVQEAQAKGAVLRSDAVLKRLTAVYEAAQAASVLAAMPELATVADSMLKSSGFEDQDPNGGVIDPIPNQVPQAPPAPVADPTAPLDQAPMQPAPAGGIQQ